MKLKIALLAAAFALSACAPMLMPNQAQADRMPAIMFVDLLYLQPGVDVAQAEEYFSRITPVVARHGLKRVGSFRVTKKMSGSIEPDLVNLWVVAGPQTFKGIFNDKNYLKHVPFRDSTFDMKRANMFMLAPTYAAVKFPSAQ